MAKATKAKRKNDGPAKASLPRERSIPPDCATRMLACWGLLTRAAIDIGVKIEGSSKLARAFEDVVQVRDVLEEVSSRLCGMRLDSNGGAQYMNEAIIHAMALQSRQHGRSTWDYWREKSKADQAEEAAARNKGSRESEDDDEDDDWPAT